MSRVNRSRSVLSRTIIAAPRGRVGAVAVCAFSAVLLAGCFGPSAEKELSLARERLGRGEPIPAVIHAKSALDRQPESAAGRYLLGRALLASGDVEGAATELKRAESLRHPEDELAPALAELWLAQGQPRDVLTRFDGKALQDPAAAALLLTHVAQAQRELGQPEKARRSLDEALKRMPGFEPALILGARLDIDRGQLDAARQLAAKTVARPDASAEAWVLRGDLLALAGSEADLREAEAAYRKALALRPRTTEAHRGLVRLMIGRGDFAAARTQLDAWRKVAPGVPLVDFLDGAVALLAGDLARAREMADRLAKNAQPNAGILQLQGMVHLRLGNLEQAESALGAAVNAAPQAREPRKELARLYLRQGRPARALDALTPVLDAGADDADLWLLAGQVHARQGDFRRADAAFERARALRPADPRIGVEVAKSQIARGQQASGLRELEAVARADVDGIDSDLVLVAAHMKRGDVAEALKALDAAERKKPDLPMTAFLRGKVLEAKGDRAGARKAYEQALVRDAKMRVAVDALAAMDLAERDAGAARKRYEALLKLDPRSASAMLSMAEIVLRSGGTVAEATGWIDRSVQAEPKDAANWRAAIDLQRRLGNPSATLARAQAAAAAMPNDNGVRLDLAGAQQAAGEKEQAIQNLLRVTRALPDDAGVHLRLAVAYGAGGNTEAARKPLERARELAPDSPDVLRGVAMLALADQAPERALAVAREVQQRRPDDPLGWDLAAEIETRLGNAPAAAAAARTALDKAPAPDPARAVLLHRALLAADPAAARRFQADWLKGSPGDGYFITHLADVAQAGGDLAQAEAFYRQALRADPVNALLLNNLADLLLRRKDGEALALAQRAAAAAPWVPEILDTLAAAQAQAGQRDAALRTQQRAVDLRPGSGMLRLHLAHHLRARGEDEKAREQVALAIRLGLPPAEQADAEKLQRQLGVKG